MRLASRDLGKPFSEFRNRFEDLTEETDLYRLRENLAELSESVFRLDRLVCDFVDTTTIESGNMDIKSENFDLAGLFSDQISKRLRRLRGYRIQPEIPSSALNVKGDKDRFATLINDLLDAVILLSPKRGMILVSLASRDDEICMSAENRMANLPASRTGSILEWLDTCLHESEGFEGVGIGLYRTFLTARLWGGHFDVTTPPDAGVSFTPCIPDNT
jgi:K+-sensing histidine kinase KdpD